MIHIWHEDSKNSSTTQFCSNNRNIRSNCKLSDTKYIKTSELKIYDLWYKTDTHKIIQ